MIQPEDVHQYFARGLMMNRPRGASLDAHSVAMLSDSIAVVTGLDAVTKSGGGARFACIEAPERPR